MDFRRRDDFGYDHTDEAGDHWHVWPDQCRSKCWMATRTRDGRGIQRESRKAIGRSIRNIARHEAKNPTTR